MKTTLLAILLLFFTFTSSADVSMEIGNSLYIPTFVEWVEIRLNNLCKGDSTEYFVNAVCRATNNKQSFRVLIRVRAKKNVIGQDYIYRIWPYLKDNIIAQCELWTFRGYPIGKDDIDFDVGWLE